MTYQSKLSVGDIAFFIYDNKVQSVRVQSVKIVSIDNYPVQIEYGFRIYSGINQFIKTNGSEFKDWLNLNERLVFTTKEELLASL